MKRKENYRLLKSLKRTTRASIGIKGKLFFIQKSNGANFLIWHKGGPWEVMAQKYFKNHVMSWKHTGDTMVMALDF